MAFRNVGALDRALRALLGIFLVSLVFVGPRSFLGMLGLYPVLTAFLGYCPVYRALGWSTSVARR